MLRYDFLAALVVFFIWAALPGGVLYQDRSSMVYNIHKLPTNVAEARYIHITYKDRKSNDNLIVRR